MLALINQRDENSWTLGFSLWPMTGSIRFDFYDYPGVSLSIGLFKYCLGVSIMKHELAPTR